jgi:hypothetical protein
VADLNMTIKTKNTLQKDPTYLDDLPTKERERIKQRIKSVTRESYVSCTIFKPLMPLGVSASGIEEAISSKLWKAGYASAIKTLERETGKKITSERLVV